MTTEATVVTGETREAFMAHRMSLKAQPEDVTPQGDTEPAPKEETLETAQESTETDVKPEEHKEEKPKGPNSKIENRFKELTKQRDEAKAEAQKARDDATALAARIAALENKDKPQEVAKPADDKPNPSSFQDAFEYAEALASWAAQEAIRNRDKEDAEKAQKAEKEKIVSTWNSRLEATKTELEDYDDVVASSEVQVSDHVRDAILESEMGPKIIYHLAQNPEIGEKIAKMTVSAALREIGKLEAKLETTKEAEPAPIVAKISKAPAPITPIKGANSGIEATVTSKGEFVGSYAAYKAQRKAGKIK